MKTSSVPVPISLLLHPDILPTAKVVWVALRLCAYAAPVGPTQLQAPSGLARPTIVQAIAQLAAAGWCATTPGRRATAIDGAPADPTIPLPRELLSDRGVGARSKVL